MRYAPQWHDHCRANRVDYTTKSKSSQKYFRVILATHTLAQQLDGMPTPTKYYWEENSENEQFSKSYSPAVDLR